MRKNKKIGLIGFFISIILIFFYSKINTAILYLAERFVSDDNIIEPSSYKYIDTFSILIILFTTGLSLFLFFDVFRKLFSYLSKLINWDAMVIFFTTDEIFYNKTFPKHILIFSIIISLVIYINVLLFGEPPQEGVMENVTSSFFLFAGVITLISITQIKKQLNTLIIRRQLTLILVLISVLFIVIFGEEISWGQRIFGWESTEVF